MDFESLSEQSARRPLRGIRPKTETELRDQVLKAQEKLDILKGADVSSELIPPSVAQDVFSMRLDDLREKYPKRWLLYTKALRGGVNGRENASEVSRELKVIKALNNLDQLAKTELGKKNEEYADDPRAVLQAEFYEAAREFFEHAGTEAYAKLPTGSGKTVMFARMADALGLRTLIVVPNQNLVTQTRDQLGVFAPGREVGAVYSQEKTFGKEITVTTYSSFVSMLEDGRLDPEEYELLVLDEVHRALSEARTEAVKKFETAIKIGFTATPKFSTDKDVANLLNVAIFELDVAEAGERGILSPFGTIVVKTGVPIEAVTTVDTAEGPAYDPRALEKAVNIEARNVKAVELYEKAFAGRTAVAYCAGVEHAKAVAAKFKDKGIPAEHVEGGMSDAEIRAAFARFKSGETKILCNANLLIEGFDEPKADLCLNLVPTASKVNAEQRGGRVLRLDPSNPDKFAIIVDFLDEFPTAVAPPVLWAEISGKSVVWGPGKRKLPNQDASEQAAENPASEENRQWLPNITLEGVEIFSNASDITDIVRKRQERESHRPPEGWKHEKGIAAHVGRTPSEVRAVLELLKREQPRSVGVFKNAAGAEKEYYAPKIIEIVLQGLREQPQGSLELEALERKAARLPEAEYAAWRQAFDNLLKEHPEWVFRRFMYAGNGQMRSVAYLTADAQKDPSLAKWNPASRQEASEAKLEQVMRRYEDLLAEESAIEAQALEPGERPEFDPDTRQSLQSLIKELVLLGHFPKIEIEQKKAEALLAAGGSFNAKELLDARGLRGKAVISRNIEAQSGNVILELVDIGPDQVTLSPPGPNKAYKGTVSVRGTIDCARLRLIYPSDMRDDSESNPAALAA